MTTIKTKQRPIGAKAVLDRFGHPHIVSKTGGELNVVTGASEPGFNPLDLLFSSLAACLVLSARIAASRLDLIHRFSGAKADVTGEKSPEEPFRIARFIIEFTVDGDLDDNEKVQIVRLAEEICTVSNSLKSVPEFALTLA
ncbi:OsmC family peroxiredoxin [Neorhizobium lilium]|uniref:OsmC family peroxiredoxin n=1 Tax=Neorhizobium lilium TaxID=2503024 RepID=A0A3S3RHT5_9HYPH|nr:OsmC family protein [Neorhizobium lilium]RWX78329.1 OsmC family peroxiredoxin [Neorhizobium lilium]